MAHTIGNPLSWGAKALAGLGHEIHEAAAHTGSEDHVTWRVHALHPSDVMKALQLGVRDALHFRSDVIALAVIYPMIGLLLSFFAFDQALLPMLFPLAAGFTILGPVASIGFYELSRARQEGEPASWAKVLPGLRSRSVGPMLVLGLYLMVLFMLWMAAAFGVYQVTMGPEMPVSATAFGRDILGTLDGWSMIVLGMGVGFIFAALVLWTCSVSFPMLLDKPVGVPLAVTTSMRLAQKNPATVALWGICVAGLLVLGSLPLFLGLIVVLPVLGHGSWHFYRMAVSYD